MRPEKTISGSKQFVLDCGKLALPGSGLRIDELWRLKAVSSTYILMGRYNHSLSLDSTIMVSKYCPAIGEHIVNIFATQ